MKVRDRRMGIAALWLVLLPCGLTVEGKEYTPPSSNPENLHAFGDHVYFSAYDGIHGRELWRSDLSGSAELVLDITPGPDGTAIAQFREFQGLLYFRAGRPGQRQDLWRTDGNAGGTERVYVLEGSAGAGGVSYILAASERFLYFGQGVERESNTLWYTDGTRDGTRQIGTGRGAALQFTHGIGLVWGNSFLFGASSGPDIHEVWRFDEPTRELHYLIRTDAPAGEISGFNKDELHLTVNTETSGMEYWVSGGTAETTRLLADIYPGPESSDPSQRVRFSPKDGAPRMIFAATDPAFGRELWESDGTPEGTRLFADVLPGAGSSNPYTIKAFNDYLYFIATGDGTGKELWGYGTGMDAPRLIADLNPGAASSEPYAVCLDGNGRILFSALTPDRGEALWICSNPRSAPLPLGDFQPGPASSFPYYTTALGDLVVTVATSAVEGRELWRVDVSIPAVRLLADIFTDSSVNPSSFPHQLTPAGTFLFFVANDIAHGNELWCTDGTAEGTRLVKDILPGSASSNPEELTAVGALVYFVADNGVHGPELWRSDGTAGGTALTRDIHLGREATIRNLTRLGDDLLFSARSDTQGEELWILEKGKQPRILRDIAEGPGSSAPREFAVWNGHVYFRADNGVHGEELWRTDGTEAGTVMLRDIIEAPYEAISYNEITVSNGVLYLSADMDGAGTEMWRVREDGTGLILLRDIASPGSLGVLRAAP